MPKIYGKSRKRKKSYNKDIVLLNLDFFTDMKFVNDNSFFDTTQLREDYIKNGIGDIEDYIKNGIGDIEDYIKNGIGDIEDYIKNGIGDIEEFNKIVSEITDYDKSLLVALDKIKMSRCMLGGCN